MATNSSFTVPVITGPTKERLELAIKALSQANAVEAEYFRTAAEKGKNQTYMVGDDYDFYCTILAQAYLSWSFKGRLLNYRVHEPARTVRKLNDDYIIDFSHRNRHTRYLRSAHDHTYELTPDTNYDFRVVYNPETRVGRISMLGRAE